MASHLPEMERLHGLDSACPEVYTTDAPSSSQFRNGSLVLPVPK